MIQDEIAEFLDASEFLAADVVNLTRNKVVHDIGKRGDEIIDVHEDAVIPEINVVRNSMQRPICEKANNAAIVVVILAWSVCVEEPQANDRITKPLFEIHDLNFIDPFRYRIVVVLNDGVIEGNIFGENVLMLVSIDFGR